MLQQSSLLDAFHPHMLTCPHASLAPALLPPGFTELLGLCSFELPDSLSVFMLPQHSGQRLGAEPGPPVQAASFDVSPSARGPVSACSVGGPANSP